MTFRKWMSLLLALAMMMSCAASFAEDAGDDDAAPDLSSLTEEQLEELRELDEADEDDGEPAYVAGPVWHEMDLSEVDASTPVLYTCRIIKDDTPIYSQRVVDKAYVIARTKNKRSAELFYVGANWCIVRYNDTIGYIKREKITEVTPVDPVNTSPYGVQKSTYLATTAQTCYVRKSMSEQDDCWVVLNPGTKLSIWRLLDGWAVVPYWRTYGYIRIDELTDLIPVSPTDKALRGDTPIAAYTSYYSMAQTDINMNRLVNIDVACRRLTRVMQPGESFNFNKMVGPYRPSNGYMPAIVLVNGTSTPGYGGGTCQVSSTLYNALLQLPGITILQRRPHGPSGAKYLPHGVDAAVGNDNLNLRFRNDYNFPIRIEGHTSYDGALLMVVYRVSGDAVAASVDME